MKKKFLVVSFLVVIFGVFLWVIIKQGLVMLKLSSFEKGDNWQYVKKSNDPIYDKVMTVEKFVENRVNNFFPFYSKVNGLYFDSVMNIDSLYLNDIYLKDNSDREHLFYNRDNSFYYVVNRFSNEEINNRIDRYVNYFNGLVNKYSNVKFGIYLPLRYEFTNNIGIEKNRGIVDNFIERLDKRINLRVLDTNDTNEYLNYFYRSDHHYNGNGALKAYYDILDMFDKVSNDGLKVKNVVDNYYGSEAKSLLSLRIGDKLTTIDKDMSVSHNELDKNFKPLNINKRDNLFYDYYVGYFNGQYDEIIYKNNISVNSDNLLIIGDSFAWQIDYLLAESFNNTYVINLRYGKWLDNDLLLDSYIKENNITHILFLQESKASLIDADDVNLDKRVR